MKKLMRSLGWMLAGCASTAYAAQGGTGESTGWLGPLFIGFFAVIVVTQLVPAVILFVGMLKGILSAHEESAATESQGK